jgi:hypothetical protein
MPVIHALKLLLSTNNIDKVITSIPRCRSTLCDHGVTAAGVAGAGPATGTVSVLAVVAAALAVSTAGTPRYDASCLSPFVFVMSYAGFASVTFLSSSALFLLKQPKRPHFFSFEGPLHTPAPSFFATSSYFGLVASSSGARIIQLASLQGNHALQIITS